LLVQLFFLFLERNLKKSSMMKTCGLSLV